MCKKTDDFVSNDKTIKQVLYKKSMFNDFGLVNGSRSFPLFGPSPLQGNEFLFGGCNWLNKSITEFTVQLFWAANIPIDFAGYYAAYPKDFNNASFKIAFSVLKDGKWKPLHGEPLMLFEEDDAGKISRSSTFILNPENTLIFPPVPEDNNDELQFNDKTTDGFVKIKLTDPIYGFGSALYPEAVSGQLNLYNQHSFWKRFQFWKKRTAPIMPPIPYVPLVDQIVIGFTYLNPLEEN